MSLAIDVNTVRAVMVGGEKIYVRLGSFTLDAYEFSFGDDDFAGGGLGYRFRTVDGKLQYGPIEAIQMVEVSG